MVSLAPIYFQFTDKKSALLALDTLQEVGYTADMLDHRHPEHQPVLQVLVENADLTSALEIAQAHGGRLYETVDNEEPEVYTSAYGLEGLSIPAHTVTEDLPESYLAGEALTDRDVQAQSREEAEAIVAANAARQAAEEGAPVFDPSGEDYNHFSAGVHL